MAHIWKQRPWKKKIGEGTTKEPGRPVTQKEGTLTLGEVGRTADPISKLLSAVTGLECELESLELRRNAIEKAAK
jgi:hypothetical protein